MTEIPDLPPWERAKRYRQLQADARQEAEQAPSAARGTYLLMAAQWDQLAAEAESTARKLAGN